jgi:hypothetical protein
MNENWYPLSGFFINTTRESVDSWQCQFLVSDFQIFLGFWLRICEPDFSDQALHEVEADFENLVRTHSRMLERTDAWHLSLEQGLPIELSGIPDPLFSDQYLRQRDRRASEQPNNCFFW